jgi:hypothetical protein
MNTKYYWHFLPADKCLRYGDGRKVEVGSTLTVPETTVALCSGGLHASEDILDALKYAPGAVLCKVILGGKVIEGRDKVVASERTVVAMLDATEVLIQYTKWNALQVVSLWNASEIVLEYLHSGYVEGLPLRRNASAAASAADAASASASVDAYAADAAASAAYAASVDAYAYAYAASYAAYAADAASAADAAYAAAASADASKGKLTRSMQRTKLLELVTSSMENNNETF